MTLEELKEFVAGRGCMLCPFYRYDDSCWFGICPANWQIEKIEEEVRTADTEEE